MRELFYMGETVIPDGQKVRVRPSVRGVIIRNGKVCLLHSIRNGEYSFPGGGLEMGETQIEALHREVMEEAGLKVIPGSERELGQMRKVYKDNPASWFIQDNYYYLCDAYDEEYAQKLESYEVRLQLEVVFVDPAFAIKENERIYPEGMPHGVERENLIFQLLIDEKYV